MSATQLMYNIELRDYFAGQVFPHLLQMEMMRIAAMGIGGGKLDLDVIAKKSYEVADAMVKAREADGA